MLLLRIVCAICLAFVSVVDVVNAAGHVVARVNHDVVTHSMLLKRMKTIALLQNSSLADSDIAKRVQPVALRSLIDESLYAQEGKKQKKQVDEKIIDNAIATIEKDNNMPAGLLKEFFSSQGADIEDFRRQIRSNILAEMLAGEDIQTKRAMSGGGAVIGQTDVENIIDVHGVDALRVKFRIFTASKEFVGAERYLQTIRKSVKSCNDTIPTKLSEFVQVAEQEDEIKKLTEDDRAIIAHLKVGHTSAMMETEKDYMIYQMCAKTVIDNDKVSADNLMNFAFNRKVSHQMQRYYEQLHKRAYIIISSGYEL